MLKSLFSASGILDQGEIARITSVFPLRLPWTSLAKLKAPASSLYSPNLWGQNKTLKEFQLGWSVYSKTVLKDLPMRNYRNLSSQDYFLLKSLSEKDLTWYNNVKIYYIDYWLFT